MTENKRFELIDDYIIGFDGDYFDLHKLSDIRSLVTVMGYVIDENVELKQELYKIYKTATVNKVREIVENVYDDLLYESTDESDYARKKIIKCLEDIDEFYDEVKE